MRRSRVNAAGSVTTLKFLSRSDFIAAWEATRPAPTSDGPTLECTQVSQPAIARSAPWVKRFACGSHGSSCPGSHGLGVRSDAVASVAGDRLVARSGFSGWQFRLRLCGRCCDGADGVTKAVHWLALHDLYIKDHRPDLDRLAQIPWRIALEPTVTRPSWTMRFVAETSSGSASLRSSRHSRNKASRV
jgi:hypothetical protein